jgi:hypothetical protein
VAADTRSYCRLSAASKTSPTPTPNSSPPSETVKSSPFAAATMFATPNTSPKRAYGDSPITTEVEEGNHSTRCDNDTSAKRCRVEAVEAAGNRSGGVDGYRTGICLGIRRWRYSVVCPKVVDRRYCRSIW